MEQTKYYIEIKVTLSEAIKILFFKKIKIEMSPETALEFTKSLINIQENGNSKL
jgi:hypothetical protein